MNVTPKYKDIVIIGNGPSAITLSYMLAGNWPYYNSSNEHPDEYLHTRLCEPAENECSYEITKRNINEDCFDPEYESRFYYQKVPQLISLIGRDLNYLSSGLQGRSFNPVSVLMDTLQHPEADFGTEHPSTLSWKHRPDKVVNHIVIGKGLPGGAWDKMDDCNETLTISLKNWMQLPGMSMKQWVTETNRSESRVSLSNVAKYYRDYVSQQGLTSYFKNHSEVNRVEYDYEKELWEVSGYHKEEKFKYLTPKVVLATGNSDSPNMLRVPGENLQFVLHSLNEFEHVLNKTTNLEDPILIVGAGLSAADAIIAARFKNIPVVHAFRRHPDDPALVFNQLPENMYLEYHKVHSKMKRNSLPSNVEYKPFPMHCVQEIRKNKEVVLANLIGADDTQITTNTTIKVSYVLVLIGMKPDLSFLKPKSLRNNLGIHPKKQIDTRSNPVFINPFTHECENVPGLYALGPLVGDNFVRFVQGGALAITNHIWTHKNL